MFLAVDLPPEVRAKAADLSARLQKAAHFTPLRANWVPPANMHITIHFLGPVANERIDRLGEALPGVCRSIAPFRLGIRGIGFFPDEKLPKVLWAGVGGAFRALLGLRNDLERMVRSCGVEIAHADFHAHVTIARFKSLKGTGAFVRTGREYATWKVGEFDVPGVTLFESAFTKEAGVHYVPLARAELGGGEDSAKG